jgi:uncharacterized OsmC-like protein
MAQSGTRGYTVYARSTDTFGRVQCNARNQHFIVDGPIQNGCPGEAITPAELFLAGIAACGVELVQVIARERELAPSRISVEIEGAIDRANPVRSDLSVFNYVHLRFRLAGVTRAQGNDLIERFKGR